MLNTVNNVLSSNQVAYEIKNSNHEYKTPTDGHANTIQYLTNVLFETLSFCYFNVIDKLHHSGGGLLSCLIHFV